MHAAWLPCACLTLQTLADNGPLKSVGVPPTQTPEKEDAVIIFPSCDLLD